jgi:hypothetical protein
MSRNSPPLPPHLALARALDEARFGAARTLNLRESLPTAWEATVRADAWLRERQASGVEEVLVITGRGKGSAGGVSPVRTAVVALLSSLQRKGVVSGVREHTSGSFIVGLVPMRVAARRGERARREPEPPRVVAPDPQALAGLAPETRAELRALAAAALAALGMRAPAPSFVEDEMLRQLARIIGAVPEGADREARLRAAFVAAREALED